MILTCPECATRYQTDPSHFAPDGRKVRCAKCGHVWFQPAPASEPEADIGRAEELSGPDTESIISERSAFAPGSTVAEPPAAFEDDRGGEGLERLGLVFGWTALAAIVVGLCWSAIRYRDDIAGLWPQTSSLYAAIGIPVNTRGIAFRDKDARYETENGLAVLVITGNIVNISGHELTIPPIRVSLTDANKRELYHWSFLPGVPTLGPGQSAPFRTRLQSPPADARHIELRFAERGS